MAQVCQKDALQTADTTPKPDDAVELPPPDGKHIMNSDQLLNEEVIMPADIMTSDTTVIHSENMSPTHQTVDLSFRANYTLPLNISYDLIDQNIGSMEDIMFEQSACARNDTCSENKEFKIKNTPQTKDDLQICCDETSLPDPEPILATRETIPIKATLAKAKQEETATKIGKHNWANCLKELCATREPASTTDQRSRVAILLNCNGLQQQRYMDIENKAAEAQADMIALTEAHVRASSLEEREQQEALWARQHPGWAFHFAANGTKRAAGVAFPHRKHLKYDVFRGINSDGCPINKAMEHQGRYIIAVPSNRTEDRTDMVIVYANNSGNTGDDLSEHKRLAHDIQRLREFYKATHPDRVLLTLGDLNFSSPNSRSVKPTTSRTAKQTSETALHCLPAGDKRTPNPVY